MPMRTALLTLLTLGFAVGAAIGQAAGAGQSGRRALLPPAREIALARSAAPPEISDSATIYVLGENNWEIAVRGSNGVACHVNRSWVASLEPHCFDAEGAATILLMELRRTELLHQDEAWPRRAGILRKASLRAASACRADRRCHTCCRRPSS